MRPPVQAIEFDISFANNKIPQNSRQGVSVAMLCELTLTQEAHAKLG